MLGFHVLFMLQVLPCSWMCIPNIPSQHPLMLNASMFFPALDNLTYSYISRPLPKLQISVINCLLAFQNQHVIYNPQIHDLGQTGLSSLFSMSIHVIDIHSVVYVRKFGGTSDSSPQMPLLLLKLYWGYLHLYFHQWCADKWLTICSVGMGVGVKPLFVAFISFSRVNITTTPDFKISKV